MVKAILRQKCSIKCSAPLTLPDNSPAKLARQLAVRSTKYTLCQSQKRIPRTRSASFSSCHHAGVAGVIPGQGTMKVDVVKWVKHNACRDGESVWADAVCLRQARRVMSQAEV